MGALADAAGRPAGVSAGAAASAGAPGAACAADLVGCAHCGLPVPPALVESGAERQFCCSGCRTVWAVIHEHGLERYYGVRDDSGVRARRRGSSGAATRRSTIPRFSSATRARFRAGSTRSSCTSEGVHCAACVWLVERVPRVVPGAVEVRLDIAARARWSPGTRRSCRSRASRRRSTRWATPRTRSAASRRATWRGRPTARC